MNLVEKLLNAIKTQRKSVVIIGDTMQDWWVHGRTEQCQDGCAKFVQEHTTVSPGGAANAERCLSKWPGIDTHLYGFADNDCPIKMRYVEGGKIVFRSDEDSHTDDYRWARELALEMVPCAGAVLLSDYDKGFLTPEFITQVAGRCAERGVPCVADCKREPKTYPGCILKGNGFWGVVNWVRSQPDHIPNIGAERYVETHGAEYPAVWDSGWLHTDIPSLPPVRCVNHVGAGDCFAAHLALALAYKFSLKEAAALAHSAGRVYVQHPHNRPPLPEEVAADMLSAT